MPSLGWRTSILGVVLLGAIFTACRSTFVVVPSSEAGYTAADTLRGHLRGNDVRVTFRVDTITRVRTVTRVDTLFRDGRDTVLRVDTLRLAGAPRVRVDTLIRVDTVRIAGAPRVRVDTVTRVDTVLLSPAAPRVRVDTLIRLDTVRITLTDTLRVAVTDTLRVPGQRLLFLPPGHYPPPGQCRVWIHGTPPGQQADSAPCDTIRSVPPGAFILFGGEAWDFDYDWLAEAEARPGSVPPEIIALTRRGGR